MSTILDLKKKNDELKKSVADLGELVNNVLQVVHILKNSVTSTASGDTFRTAAATALNALPADILPDPFA